MEPVWFTTTTGEVIPLAPGVRVVIGWAGEHGVRGSGATHRTEVVAALAADGSAVILTGGTYKGGRTERTLNLYRADGSPTTQIVGRA